MDKNFIIAFLVIIGSFFFFNSDLYNHTILNKPKQTAKPVSSPAPAPAPSPLPEAKPTPVAVPVNNPVESSVALLPDTQLTKNQRIITVINDHYIARFSTLGACAQSWVMKDYKDKHGQQINLIPDGLGGILNLSIDKKSYDYISFTYTGPETLFIQDTASISFKYLAEDGSGLEKKFSFTRGKYDFDVSINLLGNLRGDNYIFGWKSGIIETEENISSQFADNPISIFFGDDVDHPVDTKDTAKDVEGQIKWVSLRSQYFSGTFIPEKPNDYNVSFKKVHDLTRTHNGANYSFDIQGKIESSQIRYKIILCPNKYSILDSYDIKLEKIIFKGYTWFFRADLWFPALCGLILNILNMFYGLIPNYGIAILFLTLLSKIVTLPLTLKSSKSMARMKLLQPKIEAIRAQYKSDPLNMNKAVMKLYKEEGVNPLGAGGCLPLVLQMPIFIALFVALRKSIELRGAPFLFWITDLSGPEALYMLPQKILFYGPNVSLLTVIMAVTMFFQSKQTMTDPNQKALIYIMPIVMLFMLNNMPAGLMLYWSFSNILGIIQNKMIKVTPEEMQIKPKAKRSLLKPLSYNEMLKRMGRKK